jgi:hypothetical protein
MMVSANLFFFSRSQCLIKSTLNIARNVIERTFVKGTQSPAKRFGCTILFSLAIWKNSIAHMHAAIPWANENTKTAKVRNLPKVAARNP